MDKSQSRVRLTAGRIDAFACPSTKMQAFLWDTDTPTLALRAAPTGRKTYVFESRLRGATVRIAIGTAADWPIERARSKAQSLKMLVDSGVDPREVDKQQRAAEESAASVAAARALTVGDLWPQYLLEGRPKRRAAWKPRYLADLKKMAAAGGEKKLRGKGLTRPGPLYPLLALPLAAVDEDGMKSWYDIEARSGEHQATRALMMFRGFLRWCAAQPKYRDLVDRSAASAPAIAESLPSNTKRTDCLEAAQVRGWFDGVEALSNRTASAYLQCVLLTGARREEMASLTWKQVDQRWKKLTLADKVDATRTIPLSGYVAKLIKGLPRASEFVFASDSKAGHITDSRSSHSKVLAHAGIEALTLHGLRRSFSILGEAAGAPAGAIAQVMGHKPSATAEGYRPRSVDALRPFLALIEAHILALAGVVFDEAAEPGKCARCPRVLPQLVPLRNRDEKRVPCPPAGAPEQGLHLGNAMAKQWYTVAEALQFTSDQIAPLPKSGGHRLYARSDWFPPDTVVGQFTPIRFRDDAAWFPPGVVDGPFCPLGAAFTPIHFKTAEEAVNSNVKDMHWLTLSSMIERGQLTLRTPMARAPLFEWNPYSSMEEFENYLLSEPEMRTFCAEFGIVLPSLELIPEAKAVNVSSSETTAQRQARRYQMCIDAGLHMPGDDYSRLPRGVNRLAKLENITRQAFSEDVKAQINRLNKR